MRVCSRDLTPLVLHIMSLIFQHKQDIYTGNVMGLFFNIKRQKNVI